jgi:[ribosomal protein S18]-alanine N-acetyltransferase
MIDYSSLLFRVEPMTLQDIPPVMEIEEITFSLPWSARAYDYELRYNEMAYYFVVRQQGKDGQSGRGVQPSRDVQLNAPTHQSWWRRLQTRQQPQTILPAPVVGYAGFWVMVDEAHISTLASHPQRRRQGIAELLLIAMTERAAEMSARVMTLEVRVSNTGAQTLYRKFGFEVVGRRPQYYSDNNEDALIMTTPPIASAEYQRVFQDRKAVLLTRLSR